MKRALKVVGVVVLLLIVAAVVALNVMASKFDAMISLGQTPLPAIAASTDPERIARGEYLVRTVGHCTQCHGDYPRNAPAQNSPTVALSGGFEFKMGPLATLYSANLTSDPETGIGRRTDAELARTLTSGVLADGTLSIFMRYSAARFAEDDLICVLSYLRSLPPVKKQVPRSQVSLLGRAIFSTVTLNANSSPLPNLVPAGDEPSAARGAYLAENVTVCTGCHSHFDMQTFSPTGPVAAGGDADPSPGDDADMEFAPPNLTSHPAGVTALLTEDAFVARFRAGRVYASSKMPWENFSRMSEGDLRSIYRYLRSLPPADNEPGPSYRKAGWKKS